MKSVSVSENRSKVWGRSYTREKLRVDARAWVSGWVFAEVWLCEANDLEHKTSKIPASQNNGQDSLAQSTGYCDFAPLKDPSRSRTISKELPVRSQQVSRGLVASALTGQPLC